MTQQPRVLRNVFVACLLLMKILQLFVAFYFRNIKLVSKKLYVVAMGSAFVNIFFFILVCTCFIMHRKGVRLTWLVHCFVNSLMN